VGDVLKVDADSLWLLAEDVTSVGADLNATNELVSRYGDAVGASCVRDALGGFESHWSRGRREIAEKAETLSSMLSQSADAYVDTDGQVGAALSNQHTSVNASGTGACAV
jgi:Excreted virulence factor EspC, type VII ESX diderm